MNWNPVEPKHHDALLSLARESIKFGIDNGSVMEVDPASYPAPLRETLSTYVTLHKRGDLRGCIGHLEARYPLVVDLVHSAYAAAFHDTRFPPVSEEELNEIDISISVLSPLEEIEFSSEEDLLQKVIPGKDGLVLQDHGLRGCFLPVMWERLPSPEIFLKFLKEKAGLPHSYWSETLRVFRFRAQKIPNGKGDSHLP
ncbi:MAG: AmmeMemoRadiSam system protein A [Candidatus Dadabacteria bacterium]|nr:MAG: AmmeMemoRadiSam system protein A [Candidatus Dadabacteria bacterium]